jgi:membrane-associated protease RseP (regulator of RpoE activity)
MVVRQQGNLYSFKYCRAFDKVPVPEVAQIRKDYFLNPINYSGGNETQKIAAGLFESPACRTVGKEVYGVPKELKVEHAEEIDDENVFPVVVFAGLGGFAAVSGGFAVAQDLKASRADQNTLTFWRGLRSNKISRLGIAFTVVGAALSGTMSYVAYKKHKENGVINAKNEQENALQDDLAISVKPGVAIVDSMAEFGDNFQKGLDYAVAHGWFVEI